MSASDIRPHLAFAKGLDFASERDVRYAVDGYVERAGETFGRYHFNREHAVQAILFFPRYCRLTKGDAAGRPFPLSDWQALDIIGPAWGWKCENGSRRYRRATIWVPRKNAKSELMGGVSHLHLLGDGEYGGEGYCVATKEDQARIVLDVARRMVLLNEDLAEHMRVFADSIYCEELFASFRVLGGKAEGTHGKGASFRIADELHEFKDDRLLKFIDQGMGARAQPMSWDISTAGLQSGYGWELWNVSRKLHEGILRDDRTLVAIYAANPDDDPYDPVTWARANPNLGISLKREYLIDAAEIAKRSSRDENDFKRYHLNLWVGQIQRWLKIEQWNACGPANDDDAWRRASEELRGRKGYIGVDLAEVSDTCSEVIVFPPAGGDPKWRVLVRIWLPEDGIEDRVRHEMVPWDNWAAVGAVTLTPGDCADHEEIRRQIMADLETYDIQAVGFDPWQALAIMNAINEVQPGMAVKVSQSMGGMSNATKMLERLVRQALMDHGNHPILRWMADNVTIMRDSNGNIKPDRKRSTQKIDGIVALVIALALTDMASDEPATPSLEVITL